MDNSGTKITINDVATLAGVSVATVSRILNGTANVKKSTREKVEKVIYDNGYKPNMAAQSLKTQRTRNILLIVPDISNPFYSSLSKSLQVFIKKKNYLLTFYNTNESLQEELIALATAQDMCAGGIIFASISSHKIIIDKLREMSMPVVLLNSYGACEFDTVHGVPDLGTYLSTRHLIEMGHRKIAYVGGSPETTIGASRKNGYVKAMNEEGIEIDNKYIFEMGFSEDVGYKAGIYFASISERPTAICCANDTVAIGLLSTLYDKNIKVPDEISVTGMDDIIYSRISNPPITTITNDSTAFAKAGFELLFDRIEGKYQGEGREILIDRQLIERQSVAKIL